MLRMNEASAAPRIRWIVMLICVCLLLSTKEALAASKGRKAAQGTSGSSRSFVSETITAEQLARALVAHEKVVARDVTVTGPFVAPPQIESLTARFVTFTDPFYAYGVSAGKWAFSDVVFDGPVTISYSYISDLTLERSLFEQPVTFANLSTDSFSLHGSTFHDRADFSYTATAVGDVKVGCSCLNLFAVSFSGYVDFTSALAESINTTQLNSSGQISIDWQLLRDHALREGSDSAWAWVDIYWSYHPSDEVIRREAIYEDQLRFWKKNYEELGRPRDALAINREIIVARRHFLLRPWDFEWWVVWGLDVLTGFGTHPYRPLAIASGIIVLFAALLLLLDPFEPSLRRVGRGTRLSIVLAHSLNNFVPLVKIIDENRWPERPTGGYRWIEVVEKLVGIALLSLTAYSIKTFSV